MFKKSFIISEGLNFVQNSLRINNNSFFLSWTALLDSLYDYRN